MWIKNTLEGDDVFMLELLQDLLLHQLCLEESLWVLLRNDLDSNNLFGMLVHSFKYYAECTNSKQAQNLIQCLKSALAIACINLNFTNVMNTQLLLNCGFDLLGGLSIDLIVVHVSWSRRYTWFLFLYLCNNWRRAFTILLNQLGLVSKLWVAVFLSCIIHAIPRWTPDHFTPFFAPLLLFLLWCH